MLSPTDLAGSGRGVGKDAPVEQRALQREAIQGDQHRATTAFHQVAVEGRHQLQTKGTGYGQGARTTLEGIVAHSAVIRTS